ncbi:MAG: LdpA C-terminal domain-containing domain [Cyanobium sp.]
MPVGRSSGDALLRAEAGIASPEQALRQGHWVKWIAGASNQDLAAIEDLAGLHALAGVHCLDVAADTAVVAAARRGIAWAQQQARRHRPATQPATPWLMVSLSDGADPHFRKAHFDPRHCPSDCPRPCSRSCPALAIPAAPASGGVRQDRCYGCGRCLPACPLGLIHDRPWILEPEAVAPLLADLKPDAIELHTRLGRDSAFAARLRQVQDSGVPLQRLAVSCGLEPAVGEPLADQPVSPERLARELWQRFSQVRSAGLRPLWQLDGRPMRGDVGSGTAHAAVKLWQQLAPLAPPGPLQLAGGTNGHTHALVQRIPAAQRPPLAGVAFGGVSRSLLQPLLLQAQARGCTLLQADDLWPEALRLVQELITPWRLGP